jgi:membrane dipeptidase
LCHAGAAAVIVVDAHQDIAYNHFKFGRDYRTSALVNRLREPNITDLATVGLPESIAGRVALVFATLFVAPEESDWTPVGNERTYKTPLEAYSLASAQMDYYERLCDETSALRLVKTAADLDAVLATWEPDVDIRQRMQGLVILMEGADPIQVPAQFEEWHARGVRIVGPAWQATRYSAGTGKPGRLTKLGRELLDALMDKRAILDLSHLAEDASLEALDLFEGTVIASHTNARKFKDSDRHFTDTQILRLAERDGVMGAVLYNRFLSNTWTRTDRKDAVTLQTVADAMDYVCQLTGSARHIGIGTDFDGGFGAQAIPAEFDTVADLHKIAEVLRARGYSEPDIEGVMSGNMLRKLREALD